MAPEARRTYPSGEVVCADCREWLRDMRPGTVDHIHTDPPYLKDLWRDAYGILAEQAPRLLRPSGYLATFAPQERLPDIISLLTGAGLLWYWIVPSFNASQGTALVHHKNAICMHKPTLIFQQPPLRKAPKVFRDVIEGHKQKRFHPWQQSVHEALSLMSRLYLPGETVLDPFMGTGTFPLAAKLLGMRFLGAEIDVRTYRTALYRLQQVPLERGTAIA